MEPSFGRESTASTLGSGDYVGKDLELHTLWADYNCEPSSATFYSNERRALPSNVTLLNSTVFHSYNKIKGQSLHYIK